MTDGQSSDAAKEPAPLLVLAYVDELLASDDLLVTFRGAFEKNDGVVLVTYGPGRDPALFELALRERAARWGIEVDDGPRILVLLPPEPPTAEERSVQDAQVAAKAALVLTANGAAEAGAPHAVAPGDPDALRRAAIAAGAVVAPRVADAEPKEHRTGNPKELVSVLIPVYNRAGYLAQSLTSVLAQSYGDLEILIVDDGSTDGALDVAAEFARLDRRIRLHRNSSNLGLVGNHRHCLSLASGEYVKFLHTDDRLRPRAIERLLGAFTSSANVVLATAARDVIDENGVPQAPQLCTQRLAEADSVFLGLSFGNALLQHGLNFVGEPSSVLFRRDALQSSQMSTLAGRSYDALLDVVTWLTLLAKGNLAYVAEPQSEVRIHQGQQGAAIGVVQFQKEWLLAIADARQLGYLAEPAQELAALRLLAPGLLNALLRAPSSGAAELVGLLALAVERVEELSAIEEARSTFSTPVLAAIG